MCKIISLEEANELAGENFFCGMMFSDDENVLFVHDKAPENNYVSKKFPGGRNNGYAFYDTKFFELIKSMLDEYFFSEKVKGQIMEYLRENDMSPIQRVATLEFLEETTLFPFFDLKQRVVYSQKENRDKKGTFFNQFFFLSDSVVDNTMELISQKKNVPEQNAFEFVKPKDEDVKELRVYSFFQAKKEILPSHLAPFQHLLSLKAGKMGKEFVMKYLDLLPS